MKYLDHPNIGEAIEWYTIPPYLVVLFWCRQSLQSCNLITEISTEAVLVHITEWYIHSWKTNWSTVKLCLWVRKELQLLSYVVFLYVYTKTANSYWKSRLGCYVAGAGHDTSPYKVWRSDRERHEKLSMYGQPVDHVSLKHRSRCYTN